jgi:hypothetical protein
LAIVDQYCRHYRNEGLVLPSWAYSGARFSIDKVYEHAGLLRIPLFPQGAHLFSRELVKAIRRKDIKKTVRTGLVPALAVAAGARFRIAGKEEGIW